MEPEICRKCGTPRLSDAGYCVTCGTKYPKVVQHVRSPGTSWAEGADPAATSPAPEDGAAEPAPGRRWGRIAGAAGVAILIAISAVVFFTGGSEGGRAYALQFSKAHPGDTYRYHMTMLTDLTMSSTDLGLNQPVRGNIDMVVQFKVVSVDKDGVATVEFSIKKGTIQTDGVKQPAPATTITMRLASDGRVLSINGTPLGGDTSFGSGLPVMDQLTPVLPPHPVKPGDTWSNNYDVPFPFGGTIKFSTNNRFLRYEPIDGVRAAVIRSDGSSPLDSDLDASALAALFGGTVGQVPEGFNDLKMHMGGRVSSIATTWVDLPTGRWFKTDTTGLVDMTCTLEGLPKEAGRSEATFRVSGNMDITMENLDAAA
jgi:hypothetical protein